MSEKSDADLIEAVSKGNLELVNAAIDNGAKVDCVFENDKDDPLFRDLLSLTEREEYLPISCLAVKNGVVEIISKLIQSRANVNLKGSKLGLSPIHVGARKGDIAIINELIKGGADVNIRDYRENAPIHYAAEAGDVEVLKALVAAHADINAKGDLGRTAISCAANAHYLHINDKLQGGFILELINQGAVVDGDGDSLRELHYTSTSLYIRVIKEMIQRWDKLCGADKTALAYHLVESISNEDILGLFSEKAHQVILNIPYDSCRTILWNIVSLGHSQTLKTLLSYGISVTATDALGQTLLHSAMPVGNKETIFCLLKSDCDYKVRDKYGRSVLHLGAFYGHCKLIEFFISKGLKPNDLDNNDRNSLHYAVMNRQDEAVRLLCNAGADKEQNDLKGLTPSGFLHPCEDACLTARQLHGEEMLPVLTFAEDREFHPDITKTSSLASIRGIPGIGSVYHIKDFNMNDFVKRIRDKIFTVVGEALPEHTRKAFELIGVGSSAEGSKVGIPNEVDFLITSSEAMLSPNDQGYCRMVFTFDRNSSSATGFQLHESHSVWLWTLLVRKWYQLQPEHTGLEENFQMPFPPVRHPDHTTCVNWVWLYSDEVFKMLHVSIDLVIAFKNHELYRPKRIAKSTWLKCKEDVISAYIVPKIPEENYRRNYFNDDVFDRSGLGRVSYPPLEVEHLVTLQERVKVVYITAKCLRMPEVCRFKIQDSEGGLNIVNDYVTSYHLKTVFLHLADMFLKSNLSLGRMVLMVYERLELCLERKTLPMFFDTKINVLAGSRLKISESLKVARVMTKFVRRLYERDFSAELHQDAEEERRVKHLMPTWLAFETEGGDSPPKKKPKTD